MGRKVVGQGVAIFCQVDPDRFQADEKTYFRYTRWRCTRAVAQLLANLGASFPADHRIFHPMDVGNQALAMRDQPGPQSSTGPRLLPTSLSPKPEDAESLGYYYHDYRTEFPMGDNPYRYYRW
jgi:beta-galactosidase